MPPSNAERSKQRLQILHPSSYRIERTRILIDPRSPWLQHLIAPRRPPPMIDLTSDDGPIDLTKDSDGIECIEVESDSELEITGHNPSEVEYIGMRRSTDTNKRVREMHDRERRERIVQKEAWRRRTAGVGGGNSRAGSSSSSRRSPERRGSSQTSTSSNQRSSGEPSSTIRREINSLGTRPGRPSSDRDSEPPRKKARIKSREQSRTPSWATPEPVPQPEPRVRPRSPPRAPRSDAPPRPRSPVQPPPSPRTSSPHQDFEEFNYAESYGDDGFNMNFESFGSTSQIASSSKTPRGTVPSCSASISQSSTIMAVSQASSSKTMIANKDSRSPESQISPARPEPVYDDTRMEVDTATTTLSSRSISIDITESTTTKQPLVSGRKVNIDISPPVPRIDLRAYARSLSSRETSVEDTNSFPDAHDSEDEYARVYQGLTLEDEHRWKQPIRPLEDEDVANLLLEKCTLGEEEDDWYEKRGFQTSKGDSKRIRVPPANQGFVWEKFARLRKSASAGRPLQRPSKLDTHPRSRRTQVTKKCMRIDKSFKSGPGAVNRIEQHAGLIAIACSRTGGQEDDPEERPEPYNCDGSIFVWDEKLCVPKRGHCRIPHTSGPEDEFLHPRLLRQDIESDSEADEEDRWRDHKSRSLEQGFEKHYTVNDVKFNNSGSRFLSVGMDRKVKVWRKRAGKKVWVGYDLDVYSEQIPHDIVFQPGDQESDVVAISAKDIHIYRNITRQANQSKTVLRLGSRSDPDYNTGAILWDSTKHSTLYASSEPAGEELVGIHKAFDTQRCQAKVTFKVNEAGDAMALDNLGSLALVTQGEDNHYLRIFDVRRDEEKLTQKITIQPFVPPAGNEESSWSPEISCMAFSPDGLYLALARSDNSVHMYDSRMLGRGPMQEYRHEPARFISDSRHELFGVVRVHWVSMHSGRFGLLSGGEDGCVRLWNPMWSSKEISNGRAIAEVDSDIGAFSVGDPFKGEHELVVGDSSGVVTIFEGLLEHL